MKAAKKLDPEDFSKRFKKSEEQLDKFLARGGKLAYVVMPVAGTVEDAIRQTNSIDKAWDFVKSNTKAVTFNYADHPELKSLSVPDGSHLDFESRTTFSEKLWRELDLVKFWNH